MEELLNHIRQCKVCQAHLPNEPRPVIYAGNNCKLVIIGQAPGIRVHNTGIPWNDPSGDTLRRWLNIGKADFYDTGKIALMPMGFCYPGTGRSGDLPPRHECAPLWHHQLLNEMPEVKLTLLIGQYAQKYYLKQETKPTLTETVQHYNTYLPQYFPLPHPSPRNNIWQKKNPWFEKEVVPQLRQTVNKILNR